jgi:hypothetical protein
LSIAKSGLPSDHQSGRFPASKVPVHKKNDDRADHRADQTGSFAVGGAMVIPSLMNWNLS